MFLPMRFITLSGTGIRSMSRINEEALEQFFTLPLGEEEPVLPEIFRVIDVVLHKHFSNYVDTEMGEEFKSMAIDALYQIKVDHRFDPEKSNNASAYVYQNIRNTIKNFLALKDNSSKEDFNYLGEDGIVEVMDEVALRSATRESEHWGIELPKFVTQYKEYLTGQHRGYTIKQIPRCDAIRLLIYLQSRNRENINQGLRCLVDEDTPKMAIPLMNFIDRMLTCISSAQSKDTETI